MIQALRVAPPASHDPASGRVCAVVVTYNRPALLRACLLVLQGQTRPVDTVLVVDNASTDGTRAMVRAEFPEATTLAMSANGGGAGGFHAGMKWAYGQGYDWLWLMDDDARPAPDCLAKLWDRRRPASVVVPLQQDSDGRTYGIGRWRGREVEATSEVVAAERPTVGPYVFRFVGPLVARGVVAAVGLPNKDFFIWFDDIEYSLRIHRLPGAQIIVVPDAVIMHDFGGVYREARFLWRRSVRNQQPAWKTYYGARNHLYTVTRTRRSPREILLFLIGNAKLLLGELAYEPDRWVRVRTHLAGIRDGALGRLGKRA